MRRVFIATNWNQLSTKVFLGVVNRGDGENIGIDQLSEQNPILYFDKEIGEFRTKETNDFDIVLIHDVKYKDDADFLKVIIQSEAEEKTINISINKEKDYLLRHRLPATFSIFSKSIQGQHEEGDELYTPVFNIIFASTDNIKNENKASEIIEHLFSTKEFILGKKLDLLHYLLVPPADAFVEAQRKWDEIEKIITEAKNRPVPIEVSFPKSGEWQKFITAANSITDAFDPHYIKALADLRDSLLPS